MRANKSKQDYDPQKIEPFWQKRWLETKIYEPDLAKSKKPFYNLMMFPYPSAEGLHVGNMYAFTGSDIFGRYMRMCGFDVFEPIGLDGFGIHSENYALRIGAHPMDLAKRTEANFYRQLHATGNAYNWSSKLETYDSNYYKWTQWIFIQLFKTGLAYRGEAEVNWCGRCKTVLADEQVITKRFTLDAERLTQVCERCETQVERKKLSQWFFRITAYAQKLLDGLEKIDWSEKVKLAQRRWIGKSEGAEIMFPCDIEKDWKISVFTTRPDTIYGATFMVLAPEHPLVPVIINKSKGLLRQQIQKYVVDSSKKSPEDRLERSKTGFFSGFYCQNPFTKRKIPVFIADYVLTTYGTGAVMGVPAHDQRDWEFARKYRIDIVEVVSDGNISRSAFTEAGTLINSGQFNGLSSSDAIKIITNYIQKYHLGSAAVTWHLRDWIISRQRYWGSPIPMIFCENCQKAGKSWFTTKEAKNYKTLNSKYEILNKSKIQNTKKQNSLEFRISSLGFTAHEMRGWYPVPEEDLPVELPYIKNFKPTGTGVSPLASVESFVKVRCPQCGAEARRETDVSDTFLDSAWYFLRYPSVQPTGPVGQDARGPVGSSSQPTSSAKGKSKRDQNDSVSLRALAGTPSAAATPINKLEIPWNRQVTRRWLPVNMYIGGAEHSVLHLLYSRFLTMVFADLGLVDFAEPFTKFRAHGLLISKGAKMSKSKGNIVNPDEYIEKYGADTLRCYLMFCGRFIQGGDFSDAGIEGMHRFLNRVWRLVDSQLSVFSCQLSDISQPVSQSVGLGIKRRRDKVLKDKDIETDKLITDRPKSENRKQKTDNRLSSEAEHMMHKTIKKVTEDIEDLSYNTAIAALMEWMNFLEEKVAGPVGRHPRPTSSLDSHLEIKFNKFSDAAGARRGSPTTATRDTVDSDATLRSRLITHHSSLITREEVETLLLLLAPFAPHMTEELWQKFRFSVLGYQLSDNSQPVSQLVSDTPGVSRAATLRTPGVEKATDRPITGKPKSENRKLKTDNWSIHLHSWPKYDPKLTEAFQIVLVIQINGKVRDKIEARRGISKEESEKLALASPKVTKYLEGRQIKKLIFVPNRLINLVIGSTT